MRILPKINCMNENRIETLITLVTPYVRAQLSDYRYEHSMRVGLFAEGLAQCYGYPKKMQRMCFLAGITHDMCKEMPVDLLLKIVSADGNPVTAIERESSELLHGRAAAVVLHQKFGVHKKSLLNAIRYHTIASAKFDAIGKMLYIADKIEPGRKNCGYLREQVPHHSLDDLFLLVLGEVMIFLEKKGQKVHPATQHVLAYFTNKKNINGEKHGER